MPQPCGSGIGEEIHVGPDPRLSRMVDTNIATLPATLFFSLKGRRSPLPKRRPTTSAMPGGGRGGFRGSSSAGGAGGGKPLTGDVGTASYVGVEGVALAAAGRAWYCGPDCGPLRVPSPPHIAAIATTATGDVRQKTSVPTHMTTT